MHVVVHDHGQSPYKMGEVPAEDTEPLEARVAAMEARCMELEVQAASSVSSAAAAMERAEALEARCVALEALLLEEENAIKEMCADIIAVKPDLVVTEKGVSDLAQHYLQKANISVLRRGRKTDNNRIARASGATIVHRTSEIQEKDLGLGAGLFNIEKIGDEYFSWFVDCYSPKACSIVLRGASRDVLNEIERCAVA